MLQSNRNVSRAGSTHCATLRICLRTTALGSSSLSVSSTFLRMNVRRPMNASTNFVCSSLASMRWVPSTRPVGVNMALTRARTAVAQSTRGLKSVNFASGL